MFLKLKKKYTLIALLIFLSLVLVSRVHAQEDKTGFSISPPSFEINANPGDKITNSIKIENISERALEINIKPQNFVAYGESGQVSITDTEVPASIKDWISTKITSLIVNPHTIALINFEVNVPNVVEPGTHYGALVFSTQLGQNPINGANILQEIGAIILIRIPGDVIENAELIHFSPDQQYFVDPKIKLNTLIKNTGSVHIKPTGLITITDILGNKIQTIEVTPRNILPGNNRQFDEEFDFQNVGYYKASLQLFYKSGEKTIASEVWFVSIYKDRLIPITIGVSAVVVFYFIFRKRINKALSIILKG